jgi:hypothetical protein
MNERLAAPGSCHGGIIAPLVYARYSGASYYDTIPMNKERNGSRARSKRQVYAHRADAVLRLFAHVQ